MIHYDFRATGLVVFDMLEAYREQIEAAGSIGPAKQLIEAAAPSVSRSFMPVPTIGPTAPISPTPSPTQTATSARGGQVTHTAPFRRTRRDRLSCRVLAEIAPQPGDYDVPKHRWSAFHGTHLELSLRSRYIDTILLIGGSVHVGIASTAYEARDKDFQITIVPECCHGFAEQRAFFMEKVFPRMCNVRSLDEVIAGLTPAVPAVAGHEV